MKIAVVFVASVALLIGDAFAKPAGCPCSPCTCSPCSCGAGKHDRARVGVGVNVDLSGVGRRKTEADPFAVSGESSASRTQEKHKTKTKETDVAKSSNPFAGVKLTGGQAKEVAAAESSAATLPKQ